MRKLFYLIVCTFLLFNYARAQSRSISGRVTDEKNMAIPDASVIVKGTNIGTVTNAAGEFTLTLPANAKTLVISSVNFEATEVAIGSNSIINISLNSSETSMEEVVVIGYGTGKRVGSVVGNIATVNAERIQDRPTANAFDALQGKVAGLQVFTSSGEPSQLSSLRLHGIGSLGASSAPLFVMDGIPIAAATVISLNPNDFASVSILKDASATSIYGARAANGVIYITTKTGSANKPPTITFQTQYGVSNLANTDYFENFMNTKELTDFWVATGYRRRGQIDTLLAANPHDTRWYKHYYMDNAPMYQADLSISGGGGKTSYFISGGYLDQQGLAYRSGFKRLTLRSNLNTTVNNWLKAGLNLFLANDDTETNQYGRNSTNRGLGLLAQPFYSPIDPATGQEYYGVIPGWGRYAPKYLADKLPGTSNNIQFNPSGYIQVNPLKGLTLRSQGGIEFFDIRASSAQLPSFVGSLDNGSVTESFSRGITRTITNTAEYKFGIGNDHNVTVLGGHEFIDNVATSFSSSSTGQSDDRLILLGNGPSNRNVGQTKSEYSYQSFFTRGEYNFQNRYFLDLSFRQDESSLFGIDNRTANFWSVGAMWKAKAESFLADVDWLTNLSVRLSIGTTGNSSITNYLNLPLVGTNNYDNTPGFGISSPGNPLLGWESQLKTTIGANFSLFNRIRFDVSYYDRVTEDMLISVPYALTSGFPNITSNVGSLKNTGFDVQIDADVLKSRNAYITPYVNFNYNKNEVTELFQGKQYWIVPNTGIAWAVGQPVTYMYPIWAGVNPANGSPQWYVPNSDPDKIVDSQQDPNNVTSTWNPAALNQSTGINLYPPFNGGFGLTGGYHGFFTSIDFSFSQGKYLITNDDYFFLNPNQFPGFNQSREILDYWKQPGDITRFPKYGEQFTQFDSRLIEDASFVRMKGLTLGYNLPASILNKQNVVKGFKFYVTGRNLLTWTKYTGPDPEVDSNLSLGANPNTKQLAVGIDLTF